MSDNQKETLYFQTSVKEFLQGGINASNSIFASSEKMNSENSRIFDSTNNLEQDEWFFIDLSSTNEGREIVSTYHNVIDSPLNIITKDDCTKIQSIFKEERQGGENKNLLFQRIYPKQYMTNRSILTLGPDELKIRDINGLTVQDKQTDAVLDFTNKRLYFQKFTKIKPLFKGIEVFYRIATTEEIEKFTAMKMLYFLERFEIGERNRKHIAHLMDGGLLEDKYPFEDWIEYAHRHNQLIQVEGEQFVISNNKELGKLLKVLSERFYKGEVTGHEKEASL